MILKSIYPKTTLANPRQTWVHIHVAILTAAVQFSGCSTLVWDSGASDKEPKSTVKSLESQLVDPPAAPQPEKDVKIVGGGLMLGSTDNLAFDESTFAGVLTEQIEKGKWGTVEHLLKTYPDIAMSLLLHGPCQELPDEQSRFVASALDQLWEKSQRSGATTASHWQEFGRVAGTNLPKSNTPFSVKRSEFLDLLTNNRTDEALKLDLVKLAQKTESPIALLEAYRLHTSAMLIAGKHAMCIDQLTTALRLADGPFAVQASRLRLLLADAYRHEGQKEYWRTAWRDAVAQESHTMRDHQFHDPTFWKQAAFQRPIGEPWPDTVLVNFRKLLEPHGLTFPAEINDDSQREAIVWAVVGVQSMQRHESQNAILAFKKSEAMSTDRNLKNELLLKQAMAMIDGGQAGPASPLLYRLSSQPGTIAPRSRAVLGAMKLQHGSLDQGVNLLQAALESTEGWPEEERLRAEADFGLALLIAGREEEGLAKQEAAFQEFADREMYNHAAQCLSNCVKYYDATQQNSKYAATLTRLQSYESDPRLR